MSKKRAPRAQPQQAALQELLRPGQSIELLKELHILTRDGTLNQDTRRKLKQVHHLFGFIEPLLRELQDLRPHGVTLADHGAGKSYLGFIVYDLFFREHGQGSIYGIETRPELVQKSTELAQRIGFERMRFLELTSQESAHTALLPERIDIVTALHACDTATDDAIAFGLYKQARHMVLVPWLSGGSRCASAPIQSLATGTHAFGGAVAAPCAHARNGQPNHQCNALPVSRIARLPRDRDRAGRLGAQPEKRADSCQLDGSEKTQRRPAHAGAGRIFRTGGLAATTLCTLGAGCVSAPPQQGWAQRALRTPPAPMPHCSLPFFTALHSCIV